MIPYHFYKDKYPIKLSLEGVLQANHVLSIGEKNP